MKVILSLELHPIEGNGNHIFISGRINGKKARFLVDTGASMSVVDQARIDAFFKQGKAELTRVDALSRGFGTDSIRCSLLTLESLSFGRLVVRKFKIVAVDFSHVNQSYDLLKMRKIDGVIGGDILAFLNAVIDYRKQAIAFNSNVKGVL